MRADLAEFFRPTDTKGVGFTNDKKVIKKNNFLVPKISEMGLDSEDDSNLFKDADSIMDEADIERNSEESRLVRKPYQIKQLNKGSQITRRSKE